MRKSRFTIVVEVGVRLEAQEPGLIDDAVRVVDAQPIEEVTAVGRDREAEFARYKIQTVRPAPEQRSLFVRSSGDPRDVAGT